MIARHRFSADIERQLASLRVLDNWHGPCALLQDWAVIVAVIWVSTRLPGGWLWWLGYLLLALPVIATRQRALASLLHEAVHGTLTKNRRLGFLLGCAPAAYMVGQSQRAYRRSHLRDHHGGFGDPRVDPDLRAHLAHGLYQPMSGRRFVLRYLLAPLIGVLTAKLLAELVAQRLSGTRDEILAGVGVLTYLSGIGALSWFVGLGPIFLLYWIVPLVFVFPLVNWYIELLEHFPMVGHERLDILTSRPRATGPVTRHLLGIHGEGYHLDHHLSPKIPYWNLRKAHRIRLADPAYRAAVERMAPPGRGLLWQFRDMARAVEGGQVSARLRSELRSPPRAPERARERRPLSREVPV